MDTFSFGMLLFVLLHGCDLYETVYEDSVSWVPPSGVKDAIERLGLDSGRLEWLTIDRGERLQGERPHPVNAPAAWNLALSRLENALQCPSGGVTLIRECVATNPTLRPSFGRVRTSPVYGEQKGLSALDWALLVPSDTLASSQ